MSLADSKNDFFLYTTKKNINFPLPDKTKIITPHKFVNNFIWRSILSAYDINKKNVEIFHGLSNEIPVGLKTKSIVTIHDLLFIKYPQFYNYFDRKIYDLKSRYACKNSNMIIAVSNRTKYDIIKYYGIDPEKIKVIYQSCDDEFKNKSSNLLLNYNYKNKLTKPYFIFVGGTEKRKNLIFLLKVLKAQRNLNIICVGKKDSNYDNIKNYINQNKIDNQINFIKAKTTKDLASLYKNSLGLIYPSIDEGFGIPIIEAMNCSIPVITPKNEICKEIGGKYSFYFTQNNIKSILDQLNYIINNKEEVKLRVLKNNDYVKKFSNKKQGEQLIELYQSLVYEHKKS